MFLLSSPAAHVGLCIFAQCFFSWSTAAGWLANPFLDLRSIGLCILAEATVLDVAHLFCLGFFVASPKSATWPWQPLAASPKSTLCIWKPPLTLVFPAWFCPPSHLLSASSPFVSRCLNPSQSVCGACRTARSSAEQAFPTCLQSSAN